MSRSRAVQPVPSNQQEQSFREERGVFGSRRRLNRGQKVGRLIALLATEEKDYFLSPHPPTVEPPVDVTLMDSALTKEPLHGKEGERNGSSVPSIELNEKVQSALKEIVVEPFVASEVVPDVPKENIVSAAIAALVATFLTLHSVKLGLFTAVITAYLAISPGRTGDVIRSVGGITSVGGKGISEVWSSADGNSLVGRLVSSMVSFVVGLGTSKVDTNVATESDLVNDFGGDLKEVMKKVSVVDEHETLAKEQKEAAAKLKAKEEAAAKAEKEAAAKAKAEQEAAAKAKAAEEAAAKLKAEQEAAAKLKAEKVAAAKLKAEQEAAAKLKAEQEAAAKLKAEQEAAAKLKAEQEEAARLKAEAEKAAKLRAAEEARLKAEEEARVKAEEEARMKAEQEEARRQAEEEEARRKAEEEEKLRLEAEAKRLAEEEEEEILQEEWEAAVKLAKELDSFEEEDEIDGLFDDDEDFDVDGDAPALATDIDEEELGRMAREAVAKFEAEQRALEAAGEPSELFEEDIVASHDNEQDWASMTVVELKDALRSRGLKVSGRKAELIARLQSSEN